MVKESRREIVAFLLLGLTAFLLVSLFSQDVRDFLDGTGTVQNLCGPVGAAVSFHLTLWVGKVGAFGLVTLLGLFSLCLFFRRRVKQWGWKVLGGTLVVLTLSSFEVAAAHGGSTSDTLPGGYFGQFSYEFLLDRLSGFGTYLLLGLCLLVAFMVSTDTVFYPALERAHRTLFNTDRWRHLAALARNRSPLARFTSLRGRFGRLFRGRLPRATGAADTPHFFPKRGAGLGSAPLAPVTREGKPAVDDGDTEDEDLEDDPESRELAEPGNDAEDEAHEDSGGEGTRQGLTGFTIKPPRTEPPPRTAKKRSTARGSGTYQLPPLSLLEPSPSRVNPVDRHILEETAAKIEETLAHFKIEARVVEVQRGPTITQFEVTLAAGIKVHKIVNLSDDLAMALKAQSIRIVAPIPGKDTVGIEVPNRNRSTVGLGELVDYTQRQEGNFKLPLALGRDAAGAPVIADLGEMPHLLIAGSTGSGKSVCINSIITNFLLTRTPDEVKLILVDPKMVELAQFENIPHLLCPVVTDMKKAPSVLGWLVDKMEERYELLALAGVRHIQSFNALGKSKLRERLTGKLNDNDIDEIPTFLPFVVVIIDELADLMMAASKEVEASITRLSQKSRAVGIHVLLATQRPSVDVITGLIKANMPSRISFRVASRVDSRTILDRNGAEKLLGKGDMLFLPPGTSEVVRVQGTFISDKEIRDVVKYAATEAEPLFNPELTRFGVDGAADGSEEDELYEEAVRIVLETQRGSVTLLQRQLQIGYTRASRLMEIMHERGLVGPFKGSKAREVYYTLEEWDKALARRKAEQDGNE